MNAPIPAEYVNLQGVRLDDGQLDHIEWGEYYPLSLDHRTIHGIVHRATIEPGDAVIREQYVARGDETPWNVEELAEDLETQWDSTSMAWDRHWFDEVFDDMNPEFVVAGFVTVASCVLHYYQRARVRERVAAIAERDGLDAYLVLLGVARVLLDARAALAELPFDEREGVDSMSAPLDKP